MDCSTSASKVQYWHGGQEILPSSISRWPFYTTKRPKGRLSTDPNDISCESIYFHQQQKLWLNRCHQSLQFLQDAHVAKFHIPRTGNYNNQ